MQGNLPYNYVTFESMGNPIVREKFEKRIRDSFDKMPRISLDHIRRCLKEKEARAVRAKKFLMTNEITKTQELEFDIEKVGVEIF